MHELKDLVTASYKVTKEKLEEEVKGPPLWIWHVDIHEYGCIPYQWSCPLLCWNPHSWAHQSKTVLLDYQTLYADLLHFIPCFAHTLNSGGGKKSALKEQTKVSLKSAEKRLPSLDQAPFPQRKHLQSSSRWASQKISCFRRRKQGGTECFHASKYMKNAKQLVLL